MSQIRQLFRRLKRSFVFTVLSVLTLGVGIGANTAIFSMIQGVLLKPLPFSDASELIALQHLAPGIADGGIGVSQANYFTYREEGRVFDDIALYNPVALTVTGLERPERVEGLRVTHRLLPLLRVLPHLGRAFTPEDDSTEGERTVLLGFGFWQQRFGSDPDVLGRRVQIDGLPWTVIGVLPEEFDFLNLRADVVVPYRFDRAQARMANFSYRGIGRLKPGVTLEAASDDVERMIPLGTRSPTSW